jgi:SAM-dependent methyltransferase
MRADAAARLGEAIAAAARGHAESTPPPRGAPFFALDHRSGSALELWGALASHGIFRKYERVLDLSSHLGASSRWLAAMLGCTAVSIAPGECEAAAASALTRMSGLADSVHHTAARFGALPFTDASFTHVWIVEALAFLDAPETALADSFRVLRPGGHVAIQELVIDGTPPDVPAARFRADAAWTDAVRGAGFVDLSVTDVGARAREPAALLTSARARFDAALAAASDADPALAPPARERAALSACLASGRLGLIQILARRP